MNIESALRILVVDDDAVDRMAVRRALRGSGFSAEVMEATEAAAALDLLRGEPFDCVLLDYRLPRADGLTVLQEARAAGVDTPIVMLTGQGDEETAVEIMKAGATDYIPKATLSPGRLAQSLRHALRVRRAERETAAAQRALERHAQKLRDLSDASLVLNAAESLDELLRVLVDRARSLVGASQASARLLPSVSQAPVPAAAHVDQPASPQGDVDPTAAAALQSLVLQSGGAVRLTQAELEAHPLAEKLCAAPDEGRDRSSSPLRGLLAAPLVGQGGRGLGLVQLSDKRDGDFDAQDEALLLQLARMASIAIENRLLFDLLEHERRRAEEANNAKDEFLAVVSHELRTPLNAILGWIRMLHAGVLTPEKRDRALEAVDRNARAQAQLVEDLLDVSRIISGKLRIEVRPIDARKAVEAALDVVRPSIDAKSLLLSVHMDAEVPLIHGDPDRLQQVVWNLLTNAVKFTPTGGTIEVHVRSTGSAVELEVRDSGRGIPGDFLPHVFERFRQADASSTRAHGGLGLGLSIVRHIVELHGGMIGADSEGEGRGASFTVALPVRRSEERRAATLRASDPAPACAAEASAIADLRILLAEDDIDAREILLAVLEQHGARVTAVGTAPEALREIEARSYDVLVSDIGMPGGDGYTLVRSVRSLAPERGGRTPAVALTAYAGIDDKRRARAAGFDAYITKPIDPTELLSVVAKLAGRAEGDDGRGAAGPA